MWEGARFTGLVWAHAGRSSPMVGAAARWSGLSGDVGERDPPHPIRAENPHARSAYGAAGGWGTAGFLATLRMTALGDTTGGKTAKRRRVLGGLQAQPAPAAALHKGGDKLRPYMRRRRGPSRPGGRALRFGMTAFGTGEEGTPRMGNR